MRNGRGLHRNREAMPAIYAAALLLFVQGPVLVHAQAGVPDPPAGIDPIAIVPIEASNRDQAKVAGALQISQGTAFILKNGTVTTGARMTNVILPRRGVLHVCPGTAITLSADSSVPAGETPGLMLAMDRGAIEASFAAGRNSDVLITPDFRILIAGPGATDVQVRLGEHGDTCIDNPGAKAPYVLVTSVFDGGAYRVQPGQRVMFQHGSLAEVVDNEKEPCGCPASARPGTNDFPADQSAGLAPVQIAVSPPPQPKPAERAAAPQHIDAALAYPHNPEPDTSQVLPQTGQAPAADPVVAPTTPQPSKPAQKKGFFRRVGRFFRRIFGAE